MDFTRIFESLTQNMLSPIPLCFALGIFAKLIHGGVKIPKELYYSIAIFLLMAIGFMGGHELAHEVLSHGIANVWMPAVVTLLLGVITPITAYVILRYVGRMSVYDAAGIAAHYGSTSAVTFAVANQFVESQKVASEGFIPTLVTILECPGIAIALVLGTLLAKGRADADPDMDGESGGKNQHSRLGEALHEVVTGQSIMLMAGMLIVGFVSTAFVKDSLVPHEAKPYFVQMDLPKVDDHAKPAEPPKEATKPAESAGPESQVELTPEQIEQQEKKKQEDAARKELEAKLHKVDERLALVQHVETTEKWQKTPFHPFYDFFNSKGMIFRGALCIFLLEMGLVAGERLGDLWKVGPFLVSFGVLWPLAHGFLAAWMGHLAGLSVGGSTVLAAITSSASYIAAPPAVRLTLPEANPTLSITAALAITFPFNIAFGIPIYFEMAKFVAGQ